MPPLLNIPARTTDLQVQQRADELILRWTLPSTTVEGFPLKDLSRVVVLGVEVGAGAAEEAVFNGAGRELVALERPEPGQQVERRLSLFSDPGRRVALTVRNYSARNRTEGNSNVVIVEVVPPPMAPATLTATMQSQGVHLVWPEISGATGYQLYKGTGKDSALSLHASASNPAFTDSDFRWNIPHRYSVRSYIKTSSGITESADSPVAEIVPQDTFPPSAPGGLQAVVADSVVQLSWALSPEPDTAGYNVYRGGARLNSELIRAPAMTDKQVQANQQYSYTVAAVDDKGNESPASGPVVVVIK